VRRAPAFPDEVWQAIVSGAAPRTPDDQAHAALNDCIHNYSMLAVGTEELKRARERSSKVAELARELANELYEIKRRTPWTAHDPERPLRDLRAVKLVQLHAEAQTEEYDLLVRAHQGQRDPAREWLWRRLLAIWTDHFDGKLSVTKPRHRPPRGPLVRFIAAVFERVLDEKISPYTVQGVVDREVERRKGEGRGGLEGKK
jgi:hypothetical protein